MNSLFTNPKTIFFTGLISLCLHSKAQKNTVSAGGNATGSGGNVSYSIGQIDAYTSTGTGGIVTQGVQQPYEILIITGVNEQSIHLYTNIYPNPVLDVLQLKVDNAKDKQLYYQLLAVDGKLITQSNIIADATLINMSELSAGLYLLKIYNSNQTEIKTYKITKTN
jgi:hypothetical protein